MQQETPTIVVPLDGSLLALRALPFARQIARTIGARIILVRAVSAHTLPGQDAARAQEEVTEQAQESLDRVAERLRTEGIHAEAHVYYDDAPAAILDITQRQHARLVVLSSHGRSGIGRWIYGSVADAVMRTSLVPVLVVPAANGHVWVDGAPNRVLIALDGSPTAEAALTPGADLARMLGGDVHLFRAIEPPNLSPYALDPYGYPFFDFDEAAERAAAQAYLDGIAAKMKGVTTGVAVGPAAATIVATARAINASAIAIATRGTSGLERLIVGSVANGVLHQSVVPVLVVPPGYSAS